VGEDGTREELARFLRSRRERITPADVGLPAGLRRRAVGLRREEVAVLAGLSPTWYTYLEQGRDIHPSPEVLDSLARVLRLTEDERRYLHILTFGAVSNPRPLASDLSSEELTRQLVLSTNSSPYPVYGCDVYCGLIAWNRAATGYYTDFGQLPPERRNMLRWLLESPLAKERLPDWAEEVRDIVARWRAWVTALGPEDERLRRQVAEFRDLSPEFGRWWDGHDVRQTRSRLRRLRHPTLGEQLMRVVSVQAADFAPCMAIFHLPVLSPDAH